MGPHSPLLSQIPNLPSSFLHHLITSTQLLLLYLNPSRTFQILRLHLHPSMADDAGGGKPSTRSQGTVKWFNGWRGFGFITPHDENSDDLFVHQTSIRSDGFRTLHDGQRVEFAVDVGDDGRNRASDVVLVGGSGRRYGRGGDVECYNCGRLGHLARECYSHGGGGGGRGRGYGGGRGRRNYDGGDAGESYGRGRGRGGGRRGGGYYGGGRGGGGRGGRGGGGGGECYNCGEEGHFARDCPNAQS